MHGTQSVKRLGGGLAADVSEATGGRRVGKLGKARTWAGFLYLAMVFDVYSHKVIG